MSNLLVTVVYASADEYETDEPHECEAWGYNAVMDAYEVVKINDDGERVTVGYARDRVIKYTVVEEARDDAGPQERPE